MVQKYLKAAVAFAAQADAIEACGWGFVWGRVWDSEGKAITLQR